MNSTYTVDHSYKSQILDAPSTGFWHESHAEQPVKFPDLRHIAKVAGLALSLAVSPVTAIIDPWYGERRRRDAVVTMSIYKEVLGRFISRAEALRIARETLEQAERERLLFAEYEAARGIQWENHP
ncbi:MAG: hypothetical protein NNA20_13105 [Nitrospira sp.]|nr:hypothetical protein [Nitrospira sp.]